MHELALVLLTPISLIAMRLKFIAAWLGVLLVVVPGASHLLASTPQSPARASCKLISPDATSWVESMRDLGDLPPVVDAGPGRSTATRTLGDAQRARCPAPCRRHVSRPTVILRL